MLNANFGCFQNHTSPTMHTNSRPAQPKKTHISRKIIQLTPTCLNCSLWTPILFHSWTPHFSNSSQVRRGSSDRLGIHRAASPQSAQFRRQRSSGSSDSGWRTGEEERRGWSEGRQLQAKKEKGVAPVGNHEGENDGFNMFLIVFFVVSSLWQFFNTTSYSLPCGFHA